MEKLTWASLPEAVRIAVTERCGQVTGVDYPSVGRHSDFAATLTTANTDRVFVKAIQVDNKNVWMQRTEARVNGVLPSLAPRMLWDIEAAGWLVHGFEYAPGRHANLSPNSSDLPLIATAVGEIHRALTPCPSQIQARKFSDQWGKLSAWRRLREDVPTNLHSWTRARIREFVELEPRAIEIVDGDSLIHTDLHNLNILVGEGQVRIIDWAWSRRGAGWVDTAFLVIRLIDAGHSPQDAEKWAASVPLWADIPEVASTLFAVEVLGIWEYLNHSDPLPHRAQLTDAVRKWVQHRYSAAAA